MSLTSEPLVILGTFRSGTSCLSTAAAALGVYLGADKDFEPEDQFNQGGYMELTDMQNLNARLLGAFGMNYFQCQSLPADWHDRPTSGLLVGEIRSVLNKHFTGKPSWGWKEPSTTILLPLYKAALEQEGVGSPRYPILVRHPLSVVASQRSRQTKFGYTTELAEPDGHAQPLDERTMGIWMHYTLSALRETRGQRRLVISYESFLADPRPYIDRMTSILFNFEPSRTQIDAAVATINPTWSHSKHSVTDLNGWPPLIGLAYDLCLRIENDPDRFNSGGFDGEIEGIWQEWETTCKMARPILLPAAEMFFAWQAAHDVKRVSKKYSPTDSWQTIKIEIDAPPHAPIQWDPHQLPCQVWLRKAVWRKSDKELQASIKHGPNGLIDDFGALRVNSFGPCPAILESPAQRGPWELELDIMVLTGEYVLIELLGIMRTRLDQAARALAGSFKRV